MTYPLILIPFLVVTLGVTLASLGRPGRRERLVASAWTAAALFALTAVFDNAMIAADLFTYPEEHISGIRIGLAPIEDFAYPLCVAFLLPAVSALIPERKDAA
ncbi:lycopene cyclase domain-containing protein [Microbacterium oleivorans]|uniref:lycopene cyclase domain-containing protein n=1 Tax=Microbacterium oleivorans TaxID=273677 RepID=UPI00080E72DA|nr:lycopene cyclase domain-containing protein [Microbacterium oleivorans]